ncbi:MAG: hypothetical protein QGF07_00225 [Phycisphaerales bacterium]|jgi:hypothetical protein|nr:hypothetical protein [Phycisphaerales bacterium]
MRQTSRQHAKFLGWCLSFVLLFAAGYTIWNRSDDITVAIQSIENPSLWSILALLAILVIALGFVSESFRQLLNRKGISKDGAKPIEPLEMFWLISVASVMNWLPLRAGLVGRTVYHNKVNQIPASRSIRVLLEVVVISGGMAGVALLLAVVGKVILVPQWLMLCVPAILLLPLVVSKCTRCWSISIMCRYVDILLLALRYWIIFHLIDHSITLETAIVLGGAGTIASMLPLPTGGLGGREWVIGLLASWITVFPAAIAIGLLADLINRVIELVVVIPLGFIGMRFIRARL